MRPSQSKHTGPIETERAWAIFISSKRRPLKPTDASGYSSASTDQRAEGAGAERHEETRSIRHAANGNARRGACTNAALAVPSGGVRLMTRHACPSPCQDRAARRRRPLSHRCRSQQRRLRLAESKAAERRDRDRRPRLLQVKPAPRRGFCGDPLDMIEKRHGGLRG